MNTSVDTPVVATYQESHTHVRVENVVEMTFPG